MHAHFIRIAAAGLTALALAGCADLKHGHASLAGNCHEAQLTLYFDSDSAALTDAGRQLVDLTSKRLKSCPLKELRLVGLADPAGTPAANLALSQQRADTVLAAFVRSGAQVTHYTLVARGDAGAVAPSGAVEPVRRRVDVTVVPGR
jgi:outer membrane protein OmpA-like peptidoglycan-associated protein